MNKLLYVIGAIFLNLFFLIHPCQQYPYLSVCGCVPTCRDGWVYTQPSSPQPQPQPTIPCLDGIVYIYNKDFTTTGKEGDPTTQTYVIDEPGRYVLCEPLHFQGNVSNQIAIDIQSSNVTLDFNQFSLRKEAGYIVNKGVVVKPNYSNVIITGWGTIVDFDQYAIEISQASKIFVSAMRLYNAQQGLYSANCDDVTLYAVEAKNSGITISGGKNFVVENSTVHYSHSNGVYTTNLDGLIIKKSKFFAFYGGDGASIYLNATTRALIDESELTGYVGGSSIGVDIKNSPNVVISNNRISFYTIAVQDDTAVDSCTTTSLFGNTFVHNDSTTSSNMYESDNCAFIEVVGNPHNLMGLTEFKSYQNVVIVKDQG
ncbi:TPA: hypothetical protein DIC20_04835 [Candidatus Dependentiae bacterium]|nr:hypothetical protein [Candidatus Dependentiae bacterium]HCU01000.1 hypothetical protein [Candidatus Dependentiae bacterium]